MAATAERPLAGPGSGPVPPPRPASVLAGLRPAKTLDLARFEFASFWSGATGALALIVFLGLDGLMFYNSVASYVQSNLGALSRGGVIDATLTLFSAGLGDLGLLLALVSPLATMRAFSVSASGGHLDLLTAWPVSRLELTLSLHLAAFGSIFLLALLGLAPYVLLLFMGVGSLKLLASSAVGLALTVSAFSALGLAVSSFVRKPMGSALTTLGLLGLMWGVGWAAPYLPKQAGALIQGLAFAPRLSHFTLGLFDLNDLLYFAVLTICSLLLSKPVRS